MHRIRKTKNPSLRNIEKMAENMRDKHKCYASIQAMTFSFESGTLDTTYWISVADGYCGIVRSWQALVNKYRELMGHNV